MSIKSLFYWVRNLPTTITVTEPDGKLKCDYCSRTVYLINFQGVFCICQFCMKRCADRLLKEPPATS